MGSHVDVIKQSWNQWAETWYWKYRTEEAIAGILAAPESVFHPVTYAMIREAVPDLRGKRVLVPSSGDNHAVFAFHLMGAEVTSCDISVKQLESAQTIAEARGWEIEFRCEDTMQLSKIKDNEYDLVYTSNGVHVWIDDLNAMYRHIQRVLKQNGAYIMFDIHPFMRPFGTAVRDRIQVVKPYDAVGPFGEVPTYKWRMQDMVNAIASAKLTIRQIEESYAENGSFWVDDSTDEGEGLSDQDLAGFCDWERNALAALPQWLSVRANKGNND
ncbi:class I SAM-dependent methyltransferase [Paenibacillus sacheonensis]|uniref:Methyltransferase domain-containing protein n=1 Tax=Paenibacillus sacheonensis TaxID=742054 RepID=A0A7X4YLE5_9BACL|nr:class I SAM-dependent methyltransferase [Paenibacillus sacheonensis]MBM7564141.1 SAM-dependent methyltransferase [Paenibacillus sacheonensis]NBC67529.1 methyltransferase domain-containing protein [Paenibacillus sacheonensis]